MSKAGGFCFISEATHPIGGKILTLGIKESEPLAANLAAEENLY